jgi:hypothetical protein
MVEVGNQNFFFKSADRKSAKSWAHSAIAKPVRKSQIYTKKCTTSASRYQDCVVNAAGLFQNVVFYFKIQCIHKQKCTISHIDRIATSPNPRQSRNQPLNWYEIKSTKTINSEHLQGRWEGGGWRDKVSPREKCEHRWKRGREGAQSFFFGLIHIQLSKLIFENFFMTRRSQLIFNYPIVYTLIYAIATEVSIYMECFP